MADKDTRTTAVRRTAALAISGAATAVALATITRLARNTQVEVSYLERSASGNSPVYKTEKV